ncbi:extracellular solute-binding protein [Pseudoflavonifractor sp. MSJ-30]|uniref:ABC transporter substrate-binding protein n=1 Tax=Pseudoflavonifractor sp. MSJ-30 TaxID=2841525 RepID=UPI001C11E16D|nr:extracellular solute-binding protein [Pseudoflavonifractor sp. MSJ-30]MBU5453094.1 extracellular solute-binding protein [Pseudoflavonifractor sp. MSJ-30]
MKKTLALVLLFALLLTGCHGHLVTDSGETTRQYTLPESFDTSRNYELVFWCKSDTNKYQTATYQQAIEDFQALYPNIHITLRIYTDYARIYTDVITNIATETTPNICITYPDHIATYLTGEDTVVPLDALIEDPRYGLGESELRFDGPTKEELVPQFLSECAISGTTYALPFMRSTEACYVNKDYVEKLGFTLPEVLTWDFVWQVSEAAMAKNADGTFKLNGQKVLIPFIYKSSDNMMIQMLHQLSAPYARADGTVELWNSQSKGILEQVRDHTTTGAFSTFKISSYPADYLNAGQCIFAIDSTAGATWMGCDAPLLDISEEALVQFETGVYPVPQYDTENISMISQGPSVCVFYKDDPQEVLASWLFTQFLLTNDVQIRYAQTEGYVPVTEKARQDSLYQDYLNRAGEDTNTHYSVKINATRLLLENSENTFVTPVFNGSASVRQASGQLIDETVRAVLRKLPTDDEGLDAIYERVASLNHLDQIQRVEGTADLGPLPAQARLLLIGLGLCWVGIGVAFLREKRKKSTSNH